MVVVCHFTLRWPEPPELRVLDGSSSLLVGVPTGESDLRLERAKDPKKARDISSAVYTFPRKLRYVGRICTPGLLRVFFLCGPLTKGPFCTEKDE